MPDRRLAPEFVWLWLTLLAVVRLRGALSRRALTALALGYLLLVLGRYLDVTAPSLFGREVNLYWDGAQVPRFLWVTARDLPAWLSAAAVAGVLLLLWTIHRLLCWAILVAAREAVPYALRTRWVWREAATVLLVAANYAGARATWPVVSKPVIPTYWRQAKLLLTALSPQRLEEVLPPLTALRTALAAPAGTALGALRGRDVYLIHGSRRRGGLRQPRGRSPGWPRRGGALPTTLPPAAGRWFPPSCARRPTAAPPIWRI